MMILKLQQNCLTTLKLKKLREKFEKRDMNREELSLEEIDSKIKKALENVNFKVPEKEEIPAFLQGGKC